MHLQSYLTLSIASSLMLNVFADSARINSDILLASNWESNLNSISGKTSKNEILINSKKIPQKYFLTKSGKRINEFHSATNAQMSAQNWIACTTTKIEQKIIFKIFQKLYL